MADIVTTWPPVFESNPKMPRLNREVTITEKLDGSSVAVWVPEDPAQDLIFGSRNRFITPGKTTDNYDFARWGTENAEALRRLGPGCHRGEWWGMGIARRYNIPERRWSLFNAGQWTEEELRARGLPANVRVVPTLYTGTWELDKHGRTGVVSAIEWLETEGSAAAPGFRQPEGIVVWHKAAGRLFKWTFGGDGREGSQKTPSPIEHPDG